MANATGFPCHPHAIEKARASGSDGGETAEGSLFQPVAMSGPLCQPTPLRCERNSLPTVLLSSGLC